MDIDEQIPADKVFSILPSFSSLMDIDEQILEADNNPRTFCFSSLMDIDEQIRPHIFRYGE